MGQAITLLTPNHSTDVSYFAGKDSNLHWRIQSPPAYRLADPRVRKGMRPTLPHQRIPTMRLLFIRGHEAADLLRQFALAQDEGRLGSGEDFPQHFQLFQARELGIFGHQLRGVGLAARRGGFLAAFDQVGFRFFRCGDDPIHELLHIAGEDDVAEADGLHGDAEFGGAGDEGLADFVADGFLVGEERVEGFSADGGTEDELRLAVEGLLVVGGRGDRFDRVGHLERHDQVYTQRDFVSRHDFLARDVRDQLAQVDAFEVQLSGAFPEDVETFAELFEQDSVAVHQHDFVRGNLHAFEVRRCGGVRQHGGKLRMIEAQGADVEGFDTERVGSLPESDAAGAEDPEEPLITPDQGTLGVGQGEDEGFGLEFGTGHEAFDGRVFDVGIEGVEHGDFFAGLEEAIPAGVGARLQDANEIAILEEESAFVGLDVNLEGHGCLLSRRDKLAPDKPSLKHRAIPVMKFKMQAAPDLVTDRPERHAESSLSGGRGLGSPASLSTSVAFTRSTEEQGGKCRGRSTARSARLRSC